MAVKRIQNKIAESRLTLPVTACFGLGIWLLCGLIRQQWWIQVVCYAISTGIMAELNRGNALIRVYSRSVSALFIILSCVACFLFPSMEAAITMLCLTASIMILFKTYQDPEAVGWTFYTFLLIGLISLMKVQALWLVPLFWLVMAISTNSFSFRTCMASLLGLALPYFYLLAFVIFRFKSDLSPFTAHFLPLGDFIFPYDYAQVPLTHSLTYGFLVMLTVTGVVHFLRTSYNDKLRTRQLYYGFMLFNLFVFILIGLQPQHFELLMPLAIISTSPLIAHFITLTRTRITNIAFFVILIAALALIGFNLWTSSFIS